jgi:hypothetical protein
MKPWQILMLSLLCVALAAPAFAQNDAQPLAIAGRIDEVLWLADGRLALFGARGLWLYPDIASAAAPELIASPAGWMRAAAVAGNLLVTGHQNGAIVLWDAQTL